MKGKKTPLVISVGHLLKTPKPNPLEIWNAYIVTLIC